MLKSLKNSGVTRTERDIGSNMTIYGQDVSVSGAQLGIISVAYVSIYTRIFQQKSNFLTQGKADKRVQFFVSFIFRAGSQVVVLLEFVP